MTGFQSPGFTGRAIVETLAREQMVAGDERDAAAARADLDELELRDLERAEFNYDAQAAGAAPTMGASNRSFIGRLLDRIRRT